MMSEHRLTNVYIEELEKELKEEREKVGSLKFNLDYVNRTIGDYIMTKCAMEETIARLEKELKLERENTDRLRDYIHQLHEQIARLEKELHSYKSEH